MSKCIVTGASGGLGRAVYRHFSSRYATIGLCFSQTDSGHLRCDLTQPQPVKKLFQELKPELVINTVGLTDVDRCEQDFGLALQLNVHTALHVHQAAESVGAKVVHISTNDVFDGRRGMYTEADQPAPLNMYSWTKYLAEKMFYRDPQALILRTTMLSWFVSGKQSFATWLCQCLQQGQRVPLFVDQFNSPLYVGTIARWIEEILDLSGVWHLGSERSSRYDCGYLLAKKMGLDLSLIDEGRMSERVFWALRPKDVSLNAENLFKVKGLHSTLNNELNALISEDSSLY